MKGSDPLLSDDASDREHERDRLLGVSAYNAEVSAISGAVVVMFTVALAVFGLFEFAIRASIKTTTSPGETFEGDLIAIMQSPAWPLRSGHVIVWNDVLLPFVVIAGLAFVILAFSLPAMTLYARWGDRLEAYRAGRAAIAAALAFGVSLLGVGSILFGASSASMDRGALSFWLAFLLFAGLGAVFGGLVQLPLLRWVILNRLILVVAAGVIASTVGAVSGFLDGRLALAMFSAPVVLVFGALTCAVTAKRPAWLRRILGLPPVKPKIAPQLAISVSDPATGVT